MKKLLQKTTAVLVSAALAVTCALPAFAEQPTEGVTKDENVFLILNPDGSVSEQIVSDWLHSDTGFDAAADRSTLSGITNLKSDVLPAQDGENLTWTTEDNDIYYQGTTTQTPPVTVDITYTLDGRSITADALAGKSVRCPRRSPVMTEKCSDRWFASIFFRACAAASGRISRPVTRMSG